MEPLQAFLPALLKGLVVTLEILAGAAVVALIAAFLAGLGKISRFAPVRWLANIYIEVFRGTSALVQLFWVFYALPRLGVTIDALPAAILVLGLNSGSYGAEIVRGAVNSVPKGQSEAAIALNLSPRQRLWRITVPQALIIMLPPFGNVIIELLKNTALAYFISLHELTFISKMLINNTMRVVEIYILVLALYFGVSLVLTAGMRILERRFCYGIIPGGAR